MPASTCRQLSAHHPPPCPPLPQPVRRKHSPLLGILATVKLKPGPTVVDLITWVPLPGVDSLLGRSANVASPRVRPALRAFARNPVSRTEPCLSRGVLPFTRILPFSRVLPCELACNLVTFFMAIRTSCVPEICCQKFLEDAPQPADPIPGCVPALCSTPGGLPWHLVTEEPSSTQLEAYSN